MILGIMGVVGENDLAPKTQVYDEPPTIHLPYHQSRRMQQNVSPLAKRNHTPTAIINESALHNMMLATCILYTLLTIDFLETSFP